MTNYLRDRQVQADLETLREAGLSIEGAEATVVATKPKQETPGEKSTQ